MKNTNKTIDIFFKICLLFSAFLPLWICISLLYGIPYLIRCNHGILANEANKLSFYFSIVGVVFCAISVFFVLLFTKINQKNKSSLNSFFISSVSVERRLSVDFILGYILPLLCFDFSRLFDLIAFIIVFILFGVVYIKSNSMFLNFFLYIIGYRMYHGLAQKELGSAEKKEFTFLLKGKIRYFESSDTRYTKIRNFSFGNEYGLSFLDASDIEEILRAKSKG